MRIQITEEDLVPVFKIDSEKAKSDLEASVSEGATGFEGIYPIGVDADADCLHRLITDAVQYEVVEAPNDWEIMVYPTGIDSEGYCKVALWSWNHGSCEVLGRSFVPWKLIDRDIWESEDEIQRSLQCLTELVREANQLVEYLVASEAVAKRREAKWKAEIAAKQVTVTP